MDEDRLRLLNAHVARAVEQIAERVGCSERDVALALVSAAAVLLEKHDGPEQAFGKICATAAALVRTSEAGAPRH